MALPVVEGPAIVLAKALQQVLLVNIFTVGEPLVEATKLVA
jgi:hypothetical protein